MKLAKGVLTYKEYRLQHALWLQEQVYDSAGVEAEGFILGWYMHYLQVVSPEYDVIRTAVDVEFGYRVKSLNYFGGGEQESARSIIKDVDSFINRGYRRIDNEQ